MGAERKIVQNAVFRGKRHDNKLLKVQMLLSRNFVVMAQAPSMKKKNPPRTKEPFSLEMFILGLEFSFSLENFNPGPFFFLQR